MTKLNTAGRSRLPANDFAEPAKRACPIEDQAHARNAKARASQAANAGRMSKAEERKINKKGDAVLKKAELHAIPSAKSEKRSFRGV